MLSSPPLSKSKTSFRYSVPGLKIKKKKAEETCQSWQYVSDNLLKYKKNVLTTLLIDIIQYKKKKIMCHFKKYWF